MARTDPQFNLRIPVDLKAKVEEAAKESGRSATAEILARLEASFSRSGGLSDDQESMLRFVIKQAVELQAKQHARQLELLERKISNVMAADFPRTRKGKE